MITPVFTDKALWMRVALILSIVWIGGTIILSQLVHDFRWLAPAYRRDEVFGPAGVTAIVGVMVIFAVCAGIPWIADRRPGAQPPST